MLAYEADNFVPAVRRELAGTRQGRQLVIRGNALQYAAEAIETTIQSGNSPPRVVSAQLDQFVQALDAVQSELNNPAGTAPEAAISSQRMSRLVYEISRALNANSPPPRPPVLPPAANYDRNRVMQMAQAVSTGLAGTSSLIRSDIGSYPPYDGAMRDLDAMTLGIQQVTQLAYSGAGLPQLQAVYNPIHDRAHRVNQALQNVPSPRVRNAWRASSRDLRELDEVLGLAPAIVIDPGRPVPPPGQRPGTAATIAIADQFTGEVDAFIATMQPNVLKVPEGPRIMQDARALRNEVITFRQTAAAGARPRELEPSFRQLEGIYAKFSNRVERVSGGKPGPNVNRSRRMATLLDQLRDRINRS